MSTSAPKTAGFWFAAAATGVVLAALVAGVRVVGSPVEARQERLDEVRRSDLRTIEREVQGRWRRGEPTPAALDSVASGLSPDFDSIVVPRDGSAPDFRLDPETQEPYAYRALGDSTAEVCAIFALAYRRPDPYLNGSAIDQHPAGRFCFTLTPNR